MKKLLSAALAFAMLTGCGVQGLNSAASMTQSQLAAQSKGKAEAGIRAMFKAAFKAADKKKNGKLTVDEMPGAFPVAVLPGQPAPAVSADAKALFAKLDTKKKGYVTYREFCGKENEATVLMMFRNEVGIEFATLDKNGDRVLTAEELVGTPYGAMTLDHNKNGKVTESEFENAFAATLAAGSEPVDPNAPPAPPAPPAPAVDPNAPPAPPAPVVAPPAPAPAVDPNAPPAPAAPAPAPAKSSKKKK
jgi:Ca2+-binding EF-hand superfamily protein